MCCSLPELLPLAVLLREAVPSQSPLALEQAVVPGHLHFPVPAFSKRPPQPPHSFFSIKNLENLLCLTSTLVNFFPQQKGNSFDFCTLSNFSVTVAVLSDCPDSPWYPLSIFCLLSCHSASLYLLVLQRC